MNDVQNLVKSLEMMVDNELLSDVTIELKDGQIFAHKFILASRCPPLLSVCKQVCYFIGEA